MSIIDESDKKVIVELNLEVKLPWIAPSRMANDIIRDVVRTILVTHGSQVQVNSAWKVEEELIEL